MRILVITLVTIEREFEECVESIRRQTYRDYHHVVFRNLPSTAANRALYGTFMERAGEFDLFMRVDADMVIENENLFAWVVDRLIVHPSVGMLTIDIHDYFSDRLISGFHTFRNTVKFALDDPVQPDRPLVPRRQRLMERSDLGYGIRHCKDPSDLQALHYGIHRGVKLLEWLRRRNAKRIYWHSWVIWQTWKNFLRRRDRRLALAVLGAELALRGVFTIEHLDHQTELPKRALRATEDLHDMALEELIRRLQREAWRSLPALFKTSGPRCTGVGQSGREDLQGILREANDRRAGA